MKDTDLAWAAGIIDGEGCIYISRHAPVKKYGGLNPSYTLGLRVVMGHEGAIRRLLELFQVGGVYLVDQKRNKAKREWNDAWAYMVSARKLEPVLRAIYPYLIVKKAESEVAFEFLALPNWWPGGPNGCYTPTPPELLLKRHALYERMRDLKPRSRFRKEGA